LLDHSVVFFSSEIEDGNSHRHRDLPVILAGGASGQLATGRHLRFDGAPMGNLFTTVAGLCGVQGLERFGDDGTGALDLG
ncbi:MAG: transcriptional initiation protein Tat, partial [Myxococcales bacterium]|nr:transcriptional initiation protein Tat [Myxococcales bacterium]